MKTSLIILTRNEIAGVKALFPRIPITAADECLVIDYKSSDGTVEFFTEKGVPVIHQDKQGRGEAFRIAIRLARGEAVVFFSPDGNENPDDIPKLLKCIQEGFDMAIASRFMDGSKNEEDGKFLPFRAWANKAFTAMVNIFFGGRLTDTINGFRAVNKESFTKLSLDAEGFAIEYQVSIRALKLKQKIKEIPTIEGRRIGGASTAYSISTGLKILRIFLRELWIGKRF